MGNKIQTDNYKYKGSVLNGQPHGYGVIEFKNNHTYKGKFYHGEAHGYGEYTVDELCHAGIFTNNVFVDKNIKIKVFEYYYQGDIVHGLPHGNGTIEYIHNLIWKGQFLNGVLHGHAIAYFKYASSKIIFEGECENGYRKVGSEVISDGEYTGPFHLNKPHGYGILRYFNDTVYKGQFSNGQPHGNGVFKSKNKKYKGQVAYGKKHGLGELTTDKKVLTGWFYQDRLISQHECELVKSLFKFDVKQAEPKPNQTEPKPKPNQTEQNTQALYPVVQPYHQDTPCKITPSAPTVENLEKNITKQL